MEFSSWVKGNLRREAAQAFFLSGDVEDHPSLKGRCKQSSTAGEGGGRWASERNAAGVCEPLRVLNIPGETPTVLLDLRSQPVPQQTRLCDLSKLIKAAKL